MENFDQNHLYLHKSLNPRQREAVEAEDRRVLVLAGAGAGKTRTLLQKILYLIQEKGVKPQEIMAITFTKNAANEMIDRILLAADTTGKYANIIEDKLLTAGEKRKIRLQKMREQPWISRLTIRTFHSLCYSIMKNYGAKNFDNQFKLLIDKTGNEEYGIRALSANENQYEVLHRLLILQCEDIDFLLQFKRYIIDYMVDRLHVDSRLHLQHYPEGKYYTTLRGEKVRSKSEQYISDWLYRHNIPYIYEPEVNFGDFTFRPDFFIPDANLYLEHVSDRSAHSEIKEQQFYHGGRVLVKTFESMTHDTHLFNLALTRIVKNRLPSEYSTQVSLKYEEELYGRSKEVRDFLRQILRVIDMCEVDGISFSRIEERITKEAHERVRLFYQCCIPVMKAYEAYCTDKSYLDFNQLILKCINLLQNHDDIRDILHKKYNYVLVDEFQDVNSIQIKLLRTMMRPEAQLFCVGDDWQSIYGFRGSDVRYIVDFNKHFKNSRIVQLDTNYRSTDHIVNASNQVIAHNTFRIDKKIKSIRKSDKKIEIYSGIDRIDCIEFVLQEVLSLLKQGIPEEDILFLYRRTKMYDSYKVAFRKKKLNIKGKTIHSAKGLESKIVFVVGMIEGYGGFPDIWMEDRIYQILRPTRYDLLLEEERRLFYVAITRAKEILYLITELGAESSFINEIPEKYKVVYTTPRLSSFSSKRICSLCQNPVDTSFKYCPFCGAQTT